jgi:hypothetical protein
VNKNRINAVSWDVTPCASCKNYVSEELSASTIRVARIGELGTMLAVTTNLRTLRKNTKLIRIVRQLLITANIVHSSPILATLMTEALNSSEMWFLRELHGVTSQKTAFCIVPAVETSNLTKDRMFIPPRVQVS